MKYEWTPLDPSPEQVDFLETLLNELACVLGAGPKDPTEEVLFCSLLVRNCDFRSGLLTPPSNEILGCA